MPIVAHIENASMKKVLKREKNTTTYKPKKIVSVSLLHHTCFTFGTKRCHPSKYC